jgi:uridine kinase
MVEQLVELLIVVLDRTGESRTDEHVACVVLLPPTGLELEHRPLALGQGCRGVVGGHGDSLAGRDPRVQAPSTLPPVTDTQRPFFIGVAGGTGSGKTTVSERLAELAGNEHLALIKLDSYYVARDDEPLEARALANYDHPDAFDWHLLNDHIAALSNGATVPVPVYDFARHTRSAEVQMVHPARIVVVEGILVLYEPTLRERFDLKVYVDTDADIRFIRRMRRDVAERGRTTESIVEQYLATVRPSHEQFIEPSKRHADVIFPQGGMNAPALDVLLARVRQLTGAP